MRNIANGYFLALCVALTVVPARSWADGGVERFALFGPIELYAPGELAPPQWRRVLRWIGREGPIYASCAASPAACPSPLARQWQVLLNQLAGRPAQEQLQAINHFANRMPYRTDRDNFGRSDYWATPLEFLAKAGDCEDYAIFKYVSLRQLGFPAEQLEILVLQDVARKVTHAALVVAIEGKRYFLDNLADDIRTDTQLPQYLPLYWTTEPAVHRFVAHDSTATTQPTAPAGSAPAPR